MAENERPLPRPPKTPFGKHQPGSEERGQQLIADRMAEAAALGKLDEYLERELPHSEQARALAKMMMGITGMMPGSAPSAPERMQTGPEPEGREAVSAPPEDVIRAVEGADVKGLMDILRREHQKRSPGAETAGVTDTAEAPAAQTVRQRQPAIDKELIDALISIASDNSVTLDWIILRAIKVYVEEYKKTGKL
jgi:hypothetical protein